MAKDSDKIVVAANGTVYAGPVGTTAPTDFATSLNSGFVDHGYITEDGVAVTIGKTVLSIPAWQSPDPVRTVITGRSIRVQFTLMEWKELTTEMAFDGVTQGAPSEWTITQPDQDDLNPYAVVIQWNDGTRGYRLYLPRAVSVEDVAFNLSRKDFAGLPITLEGYQDADTDFAWKFFSSDSNLEESTE
jgi:hypothetical protein